MRLDFIYKVLPNKEIPIKLPGLFFSIEIY